MKRRIFVRNAALTTMGIGLTGLSACTPSAKKPEATSESADLPFEPFFKISLAEWSLHKQIFAGELDPLDFAKKTKSLGIEGLEFVNQLYQGELEKYSTLSAGIDNLVKELNKRSNDHGTKNLIMMVDLPPGEGDMAVTDDAARTKAIEAHYPWVDATAGLGCHSMRINMFGEFEADPWKAASVDALGRLGEYAAERNVNIIIENHGWLTSNAGLLMEVINEVGLDNCGTLPDFGNFCTKRKDKERWGECVEEYDKYKGVKELMPAAKAVSAKSYDFAEDGTETTIDYKKMMGYVKEAGYTGYVGIEYEGDGLSEEDGILATKNLLMSVAKELA